MIKAKRSIADEDENNYEDDDARFEEEINNELEEDYYYDEFYELKFGWYISIRQLVTPSGDLTKVMFNTSTYTFHFLNWSWSY